MFRKLLCFLSYHRGWIKPAFVEDKIVAYHFQCDHCRYTATDPVV